MLSLGKSLHDIIKANFFDIKTLNNLEHFNDHRLYIPEIENDELGTGKVIATIPSRDKNSPCYYHSFGMTQVIQDVSGIWTIL